MTDGREEDVRSVPERVRRCERWKGGGCEKWWGGWSYGEGWRGGEGGKVREVTFNMFIAFRLNMYYTYMLGDRGLLREESPPRWETHARDSYMTQKPSVHGGKGHWNVKNW